MNKIMIMTMLMLQGCICAMAKPAAVPVAGKDVNFEVVLDTAIKTAPVLILYKNTFYMKTVQSGDNMEIHPVSNVGNKYLFVLHGQDRPNYFSIAYKVGLDYQFPLQYYHFEPGDKVRINIKPADINGDFDVDFSGKEVAKYSCQNEFITAMRLEKKKMEADTADKDEADNYKCTLRYINACTAVIDKYRPQLSDFSYQLLRADIIGDLALNMIQYVPTLNAINQTDAKRVGDETFANDYFKRYKPLNVDGIADSILILSVNYGQYRLWTLMVEKEIFKRKEDRTYVFDRIKEMKSGPLRDKLMVLHLIRDAKVLGNSYNLVVRSALELTKDPMCIAKIKEFGHNAVGSKAFNFSLTDRSDNRVTLADFKGKTVLIDYYFTGCVNCKIVYKRVLKDVEKKYKTNNNMVFITISIDKDKDGWMKGMDQGEYNDPKGINLYTNGEGSSHELIKYHNIMGYPTLMLINKDGNVQNYTSTELRSKESLIKEIDKALAL